MYIYFLCIYVFIYFFPSFFFGRVIIIIYIYNPEKCRDTDPARHRIRPTSRLACFVAAAAVSRLPPARTKRALSALIGHRCLWLGRSEIIIGNSNPFSCVCVWVRLIFFKVFVFFLLLLLSRSAVWNFRTAFSKHNPSHSVVSQRWRLIACFSLFWRSHTWPFTLAPPRPNTG